MWRESIERDGFAVLARLLAQDEVARLVEDLEHAELRRSRAGARHVLANVAVSVLARGPRLLPLAQQVLGENAFPFRATLFDKSPVSNWLVVWHQDMALPLRERRDAPHWGPWSVKDGVVYAHAPAEVLQQVLALRVHLDDSRSQNGPLRVLPGTHTSGVLSDEAIHRLAERIAPLDCLVEKGGVVAMRPLIVHSSSKSQSELPRRVVHIEYAAASSLGHGLELAAA
jgi:ectoine hydroxylase-related dioxygenase (phytanoyl-CoA dioxygenase family)